MPAWKPAYCSKYPTCGRGMSGRFLLCCSAAPAARLAAAQQWPSACKGADCVLSAEEFCSAPQYNARRGIQASTVQQTLYVTLRPFALRCRRRDDPVTPLLTQWTYQAMVHELVRHCCSLHMTGRVKSTALQAWHVELSPRGARRQTRGSCRRNFTRVTPQCSWQRGITECTCAANCGTTRPALQGFTLMTTARLNEA